MANGCCSPQKQKVSVSHSLSRCPEEAAPGLLVGLRRAGVTIGPNIAIAAAQHCSLRATFTAKSVGKTLARAWRGANDKARELGWIA